MALPALTKQWYLVPNVDSTTSYPRALFDRKEILKGVVFGGYSLTAHPWTVVGSCNSATAGMDGVDRWASSASVVRGANTSAARSWIVLRNPVTARQILLDYVGSDSSLCRVQFSPTAGFTGGSTTAAPTATDQFDVGVLGPSAQIGNIGSATRLLQHVWQSTDGRQTMIAVTQGGVSSAWWMFGEVEDALASWAYPFISYVGFGDGTTLPGFAWTYALMGNVNNGEPNARVNASKTAGCYGVMEGIDVGSGASPFNNASVGGVYNLKNELSGVWDIFDKIWLQSEDVDLWGPLGYWPDAWPTMKAQTGYLTGDHLPADGSRQFVKVNDLILPWGGAPAMVIT